MLKKITAAVVSIIFTTVVGTAQAQNWWKYTVAGALMGGAISKKHWKGAAKGAAIGTAIGIIMDYSSYYYGNGYANYRYSNYYGYCCGYSTYPKIHEIREIRCDENGFCQEYRYSISPYGRSYYKQW